MTFTDGRDGDQIGGEIFKIFNVSAFQVVAEKLGISLPDFLNLGVGGKTNNDIFYSNSNKIVFTENTVNPTQSSKIYIPVGSSVVGVDAIYSSLNYNLANIEVENLTLTGNAITGSGNDYNNTLTGNSSNNVLSGLAGNDVLNGGDMASTGLRRFRLHRRTEQLRYTAHNCLNAKRTVRRSHKKESESRTKLHRPDSLIYELQSRRQSL